MFCQNCGSQLKDSDRFCTKCGTPVIAVEEPAPTPELTPQAQFDTVPINPIPPVNTSPTETLPFAVPIAPVPAQSAYPSPYPAPIAPAPKKGKGLKIAVIVGIVVIVLIAILAVIFFVVKPFSQEPKETPVVTAPVTTDSEPAPTPEPEEPDQSGDEAVIRSTLSYELDAFNNIDSQMWKEVMGSESADLESIGLNTGELMTVWTEGFEYEIGEITIDGKNATAELTITCKQFYPVLTAAQGKIMEDSSLAGLSEADLMAKFSQVIMDELKSAKPATNTVIIPLEKTGGIWAETAEAQSIYERLFFGEE
jgi:hypothetical protein